MSETTGNASATQDKGTPGSGAEFLRVRIDAKLVTRSPLHCGDGNEMPATNWQAAGSLGAQGHVNTVCQGQHGAYIPASTLRGSLRERCPEPARTRLFGSSRGEGAAGLVRVYDAPVAAAGPPAGDRYWNATRGTTIRNGVALDAVTGTAAEGKLFQFEILPEGSTGKLRLEAERVTRADLATLLGLLQAWNGDAPGALGRGLSRGWGRVALAAPPGVSVLTEAMLDDWLRNGAASVPAPQPLTEPPAALPAAAPAVYSLVLRLLPDSPLLVNQPGRVKPSDKKADKHEPQLELMRAADGTAIIPGSSLRGALRAQAGRILRSLLLYAGAPCAGDALNALAKTPLDALFGTERERSPLWFDEAVCASAKLRPQQFNAVDRFTGAVAGGLLYKVNAADGDCFETTVTLELSRRPAGEGWIALLLYLARDLLEGDIPVGWGKSRGYGALHASIVLHDGTAIDGFPALLARLRADFGADAPTRWAKALERQITDLAKAHRAPSAGRTQRAAEPEQRA
jgi:CRISPR/Cas system CSM-associated protein Csm3 (group 7 of RAMP superfamily)